MNYKNSFTIIQKKKKKKIYIYIYDYNDYNIN